MGIQGLIPFLEKASRPTNVSEYSGYTVAIDAYCWLHKGVFSCADKLARGDHCDMYVHYCLKFINMLLTHNIKPILVFDGQRLPAKADTEKKRRESREVNRKKAAELLRLDRGHEAQTYLRRCIDVTHEMALNLIRVCRLRNIDCIVAPYESDAQLAYFNINSIAQVIITEDSDLLLFGALKVLFKMDINGNGLLIEQDKLHLAMGLRPEKFSFPKFRYMCILSGCDYLPSIPGIGLVKACRFIKKNIDSDIFKAISRIRSHLNMPHLVVPTEYKEKFLIAEFMFKHQPVFDPLQKKLIPLTPIPDNNTDLSRLFSDILELKNLSSEQACQLAYGNLDPHTLTLLDNWDPSLLQTTSKSKKYDSWNTSIASHPSIWSENYVSICWKINSKNESCNALNLRPCKIINTNNTSAAAKVESKREESINEILSTYKIDSIENVSSPSPNNQVNQWVKTTFKSEACKSSGRKNVGTLSKFTEMFKSTKDTDSNKVVSRYFLSTDVKNNSNENLKSLERENKIKWNPNKFSSFVQDKVENEDHIVKFHHQSSIERSPLKLKNTDDNHQKDNITEVKYSYPFTLDEIEKNNDIDKEILPSNKIRKRLNPFAVNNKDKKPCLNKEANKSSPTNELFVSKESPGNTSANFGQEIQFSCESQNLLDSTTVINNGSDNVTNGNCVKSDETMESLSQKSEDEGYRSLEIEPKCNSPVFKCRTAGSTRKSSSNFKQQTLLSMFSYRKPQKLKL